MGTLVEHERFLTASVRAPRHGRIDVATARPLEAQRLAVGRDLRADDVVPVGDEFGRRKALTRESVGERAPDQICERPRV